MPLSWPPVASPWGDLHPSNLRHSDLHPGGFRQGGRPTGPPGRQWWSIAASAGIDQPLDPRGDAPGRPGLPQEAEVYRRIGDHPAFSSCLHVGEDYLVLRRLHGTTLYDCVRQGRLIPLQMVRDIDAAITYAESRGLHGHDVHGRNVLMHRGRGRIVDISDFLNPEPCRAWRDLRRAYHLVYRPVIAPLRLRVPTPLLERVRRSYRLYRWLRAPRSWVIRRAKDPGGGVADPVQLPWR